MATNEKFQNGRHLSLTATHPTLPLSGQPVRVGEVTGVALVDERSDGTTSIDFGPAVYALSVKGVDDNGNSAVAVGDALYYVDGDVGDGTGFLDKKVSGRFFGWALAAVNSAATATVNVLKAHQAGSTITAASLTGAQAATVADKAVLGGLPVLHQIALSAGALADTDVVLTDKTRVIDAWAVLQGAGVTSTTLTVKNGTAAITDALDVSGSDKAIVRAATLDDAQWAIAAGGTLRVTTAVGATQPACTVFVLGVRVP